MTGKAVDFCREDTPPLGGNAAAQCLEADVLCFGKHPVYRDLICYILFSKPAFQTTPPDYPTFHWLRTQNFLIRHWCTRGRTQNNKKRMHVNPFAWRIHHLMKWDVPFVILHLQVGLFNGTKLLVSFTFHTNSRRLWAVLHELQLLFFLQIH